MVGSFLSRRNCCLSIRNDKNKHLWPFTTVSSIRMMHTKSLQANVSARVSRVHIQKCYFATSTQISPISWPEKPRMDLCFWTIRLSRSEGRNDDLSFPARLFFEKKKNRTKVGLNYVLFLFLFGAPPLFYYCPPNIGPNLLSSTAKATLFCRHIIPVGRWGSGWRGSSQEMRLFFGNKRGHYL